jgi:hypothetical protein
MDGRDPTPRARALIAGTLLAGLAAACGVQRTAENPNCSPSATNHRFDVPRPTVGKMLAYRLDPATIVYHYIDVRGGDTTEYTWNTSRDYYGLACLRFATTDSVVIDSTGAFQLVMSGSNASYMDRHFVAAGTVTDDSILGNVFYGCEGDGGTYQLAADSLISYAWANGDAHWIFNPAATHRLHSDSLFSSFTQSAYGDSVRSTMRFAWVRADCGEGF